MATERSSKFHDTLASYMNSSLEFKIPSILKEALLDMLMDLEDRHVPQVRIMDIEDGIYFLIAAKDWPGLLDASLAIIHDKGYNLSELLATQIVNTPYSVVVTKVDEKWEGDRRKLYRDREEIVSLIRTVAKGGLDIRTLLGSESKKLRIYNRILKEIDRMVEEGKITSDVREKIVGEEGELIKFVRSRTVPYLEERSPRTLAEIVVMQVEVAERARRNPEKAHVSFHIFKMGSEGRRDKTMLGFTVAGKSDILRLSDVLHVFRKQGIVEGYRKEFILPDGISVVRVEIDGIYRNMLMALKEELNELYASKYEYDAAPGEEIFGRMISDRLIHEYELSKVPQLLTMRISEDIYRSSVVGPPFEGSEEDIEERIEWEFHKSNLTVSDIIVRTIRRKEETVGLYIIKFHPNVPMDNVHGRVKEILSRLFGRVRDFDESIRKINYDKLMELNNILADHVPRKFISSIFYSIKDNLRIMEPISVLAPIISHIFSSVETFLEDRQTKEKGNNIRKYSTTVGRYSITTVVSSEPLSREERRKCQEEFGERISRLSIYGNEVYTFLNKLPRGNGK